MSINTPRSPNSQPSKTDPKPKQTPIEKIVEVTKQGVHNVTTKK